MRITPAKLLKDPRLPSAGIVQHLQKREIDTTIPLTVDNRTRKYKGYKKSGAFREYTVDQARFVAVHARIVSLSNNLLDDAGYLPQSTFESASYYRHNSEQGNSWWPKHMDFLKKHVVKGGFVLRVDLQNAYGSVALDEIRRILATLNGRRLPDEYVIARYSNGLPYPCPLSRLIFEIYIREKLLSFKDNVGSFYTDDLLFVLDGTDVLSEAKSILRKLERLGLALNYEKIYIDTLHTDTKLELFNRSAFDTHLDSYGEFATFQILVASSNYGESEESLLINVDEERLCFDIASCGRHSALGSGHILKSKRLIGQSAYAFRNRSLAFLSKRENRYWLADLLTRVDHSEMINLTNVYSRQLRETVQDEGSSIIKFAGYLGADDSPITRSEGLASLETIIQQINSDGLANPNIVKSVIAISEKEIRDFAIGKFDHDEHFPELEAEFVGRTGKLLTKPQEELLDLNFSKC